MNKKLLSEYNKFLIENNLNDYFIVIAKKK